MPLVAHYQYSRLGAGLAEDVETALRASGVRGHEKVPTGGQVAVPAGGR
jgi:hypothetical protein